MENLINCYLETTPDELPEQTPQNPPAGAPWKKATRYLRELSVVIIGVAITFIVSGWIGNWKEKKALESHLKAVQTELEENLELLKNRWRYYQTIKVFSDYLRSDDFENLDPDSIQTYSVTPSGHSLSALNPVFIPETSAFETLKASGLGNTSGEQPVFQELQRSYKLLQLAQQSHDDFISRKNEILFSLVREKGYQHSNWQILHPYMRPYIDFFSIGQNIDQVFEQAIQQLEKNLLLFPPNRVRPSVKAEATE